MNMSYKTRVKQELFPEGKEIFSCIKDLTQWGHRKTGTPEGRKSAEYIEAKMKETGLSDVRIETAKSMCMIVDDYSLEIEGKKIESFYINGTNRVGESGRSDFGSDCNKQEFVYVGKGLPEDFEKVDVKGKIAVVSVYLPEEEEVTQMNWFEHVDVYDPERKLMEKRKKVDIYSPSIWPANYYLAQNHGAIGFVGILENYMDDPYFYNEDYTDNGRPYGCEYMSLPALWVSRSSGKFIKSEFDKTSVIAGHMKVNTSYEYRDAFNISGRLEGNSDDYVLVHSHHDAAFEGAVQDASGISEMLAVAKYFANIPKEERKRSMMFAAVDTHFTDYAANEAFVRKRQAEGDKVIIDLAIEHIGKETAFDDNYNLYETGEVEPRLFYVSSPELYDFVRETIEAYNITKSLIALVPKGKGLDHEYEFHQDEVISDAYYWNESGVPVVSMVCGEQYLFHISDRPDRIPVEELKPVGMAFAEIALEAMEVL